MAEIRYVIVSDLHFGAENSVLTSLVETVDGTGGTFRADPGTPSPVVTALLEGVRQLTGDQERRPTLVLAGDILDLGLSPAASACEAFSGFSHLAFGSPGPVFDPVVYYLPGNHDHHLWESAREAQYVAYLAAASVGVALIGPSHVTGIRPDLDRPPVTSAWMTNLVQRATGDRAVEVRVAYPNMALVAPSTDRTVVLSHGHFTESIYTLMSQIRDILYPDQRAGRPSDVATLEEENFAWIDFLWSTLGQSGEVGSDLGLIYAGRSTPAQMALLVSRLARALLARGKGPPWLHSVEGGVIDVIFKCEAAQFVRSERATPDVTLSDRGRAGLTAYLAGPVRAQLLGELGHLSRDLTFVFGHTHKPFVDRRAIVGYPAPVQVVNTGGWVVDTATSEPVQGAVAALIDDALEVVPLEVYRQGDRAPTVRLLPADPGDRPAGGFWNELSARIDPAADPWSSLAAACAQLIDQRHRLQRSLTTAP